MINDIVLMFLPLTLSSTLTHAVPIGATSPKVTSNSVYLIKLEITLKLYKQFITLKLYKQFITLKLYKQFFIKERKIKKWK